jgi:hypothetical protein
VNHSERSAVAELGAGEHHRRHHQRIRRDGQLDALDRGVEVRDDLRDRQFMTLLSSTITNCAAARTAIGSQAGAARASVATAPSSGFAGRQAMARAGVPARMRACPLDTGGPAGVTSGARAMLPT